MSEISVNVRNTGGAAREIDSLAADGLADLRGCSLKEVPDFISQLGYLSLDSKRYLLGCDDTLFRETGQRADTVDFPFLPDIFSEG